MLFGRSRKMSAEFGTSQLVTRGKGVRGSSTSGKPQVIFVERKPVKHRGGELKERHPAKLSLPEVISKRKLL